MIHPKYVKFKGAVYQLATEDNATSYALDLVNRRVTDLEDMRWLENLIYVDKQFPGEDRPVSVYRNQHDIAKNVADAIIEETKQQYPGEPLDEDAVHSATDAAIDATYGDMFGIDPREQEQAELVEEISAVPPEYIKFTGAIYQKTASIITDPNTVLRVFQGVDVIGCQPFGNVQQLGPGAEIWIVLAGVRDQGGTDERPEDYDPTIYGYVAWGPTDQPLDLLVSTAEQVIGTWQRKFEEEGFDGSVVFQTMTMRLPVGQARRILAPHWNMDAEGLDRDVFCQTKRDPDMR